MEQNSISPKLGIIAAVFLACSVLQADIYQDLAGRQDGDESVRSHGISVFVGAGADELVVDGAIHTAALAAIDTSDTTDDTLYGPDGDDEEAYYPDIDADELNKYKYDVKLRALIDSAEANAALHSKAVYWSPILGVQYMDSAMRYGLYASLGYHVYDFQDAAGANLFKDQFYRQEFGVMFYPSFNSRVEPFVFAASVHTEHTFKETVEQVTLVNKTIRGYVAGFGIEGKLMPGIHWRFKISKSKLNPLKVFDVVTSQSVSTFEKQAPIETSGQTTTVVDSEGNTTTTTADDTIEYQNAIETKIAQEPREIKYQNTAAEFTLVFVLGSLF